MTGPFHYSDYFPANRLSVKSRSARPVLGLMHSLVQVLIIAAYLKSIQD